MASVSSVHRALRLALSTAVLFALFSVADGSVDVVSRDGHGHHHSNIAPLTMLNETELLEGHAPTPESYYTLDFDGAEPTGKRYPWLMMTHGILMCLAFFIALPMGIAMRSAKHAWHGATVVAFYAFSVLGCAASAVYTKLTPTMYEGQVHGKHGYVIFLVAAIITTVDISSILRRIFDFFRSSNEKFAFKSFWTNIILGRDDEDFRLGGDSAEYTGLVSAEPKDIVSTPLTTSPIKQVHYDFEDEDEDEQTANWANEEHAQTNKWANGVHRHRRNLSQTSDITLVRSRSTHSDDTLHEDILDKAIGLKEPILRRIGSGVFHTVEYSLVIAGFMEVLTGIVVYTGGCRGNYVNGCLAHLIKGAIFWCYGLLTFARFLGAYSSMGWAWNRAPAKNYPTAEFVESLVIFIYGITNTWMERFGAHAGDPYTTKQIQHIGIAVMFWFAGLVGMGLESKTIRKWLSSSTVAALQSSSSSLDQEAVAEPPSYIASFNPFPALVIGVTGSAMAAHYQTYLFQVQIHSLWGNLLLAFSVLRCITYFFLWLSPPRSILPSRPPTEALAAFFLTCGGLSFMFSTEELTVAAMRRGRDDVMMFLNVGVAITCLACCWTIFVVGFNGWLKSHVHKRVSYHGTA